MRAVAIGSRLVTAEKRNVQRDLPMLGRPALCLAHRMIRVVEESAHQIDSRVAHANQHVLTIQIVALVDLRRLAGR